MNEKVRLVALDLDGTLLDDDKRIPAANQRALREVRARGIHVAICSGRMTPRIESVQDDLGIDCALIAYNGGKVAGTREEGRPTLSHRPVPADIAAELIRFSRENDYLLNFYHEDILYADASPGQARFMEIYTRRTGAEYHVGDLSVHAGKEPTKLILLAEPEETDRLRAEFTPRFSERASISKSEPEYLEITAPGVTKGSALPLLAGHLGVALEEVLAIGDADNDKEMLLVAGTGVAVGNARESAKQAADAVTRSTNNEGAVAEALARFVLGG